MLDVKSLRFILSLILVLSPCLQGNCTKNIDHDDLPLQNNPHRTKPIDELIDSSNAGNEISQEEIVDRFAIGGMYINFERLHFEVWSSLRKAETDERYVYFALCWEKEPKIILNLFERFPSLLLNLKERAKGDHPVAQNCLGYLFDSGLITKKKKVLVIMKDGISYFDKYRNRKLAIKWYERAANSGYSPAHYNLALALFDDTDSCLYMGKRDRIAQALDWLTKAALKNNPYAQFELGMRLKKGRGVPQIDEQAIEWLTRAAELGHMKAQCLQGIHYQETDAAKAEKYYTAAALQGDARSQTHLGEMCFLGQGVGQDEKKAVSLLSRAAAQGDKLAQFNLGYINLVLKKGTGSFSEGLRLLLLSGLEEAKSILKKHFICYNSPLLWFGSEAYKPPIRCHSDPLSRLFFFGMKLGRLGHNSDPDTLIAPALTDLCLSLMKYTEELSALENYLQTSPVLGTEFELEREATADLKYQKEPAFFHVFTKTFYVQPISFKREMKFLTIGCEHVRKINNINRLLDESLVHLGEDDEIQKLPSCLVSFALWTAAKELNEDHMCREYSDEAFGYLNLLPVKTLGQARSCFRLFRDSYSEALRLLNLKKDKFKLPLFKRAKQNLKLARHQLTFFPDTKEKLSDLLEGAIASIDAQLVNDIGRNAAILQDPLYKPLKEAFKVIQLFEGRSK